jgi:hypothetical protein
MTDGRILPPPERRPLSLSLSLSLGEQTVIGVRGESGGVEPVIPPAVGH